MAATREALGELADPARQQPSRVAASRSAEGSRPSTISADTPALASVAVESVALPGVVLLLEVLNSRRDARLARDLVAAAARNWSQPPLQRRFSFPLDSGNPADSNQASAVRRALRAFVDKDLQDHEARVVLYVGSVAERLPDAWPGVQVLTVSDLVEFSRDPQAKKDLWAKLCAPGR